MTTEKKIEEILTAFAIKNDNVVDPKEYKQLINDKTAEIVKLFAIPVVVGRSEQFNCPFCNSTNIHQKTKSNDWCKDCEKEWAV